MTSRLHIQNTVTEYDILMEVRLSNVDWGFENTKSFIFGDPLIMCPVSLRKILEEEARKDIWDTALPEGNERGSGAERRRSGSHISLVFCEFSHVMSCLPHITSSSSPYYYYRAPHLQWHPWTREKCPCKRVSLYPSLFSIRGFLFAQKSVSVAIVCYSNRCHS